MRNDIPVLEGWISLPVAAQRLEVKRQRIFQMGTEEDKLASLRQILGEKSRPAAYVVSEAEVCALRRTQLRAAIGAVEAAIGAAEADESAEGLAALAELHGALAELHGALAEVQLDAVRLLYVQLGMAAEAADVAGNADLAALLRKRASAMRADARVPVGV